MLPLLKKRLFGFLPLIVAANFCFSSLPAIANAMPLTQAEIDQKIQAVPQWQQSEQTITRTFKFKNFVEAIAFVSLTSHDAGGLTDKDFSLAQTISNIASDR